MLEFLARFKPEIGFILCQNKMADAPGCLGFSDEL
jgi:hypothetical protein